MASIEYRANGSVRVKWRVGKTQDGLTVDSKRDAEMLVKWLDRHGVRPSSDPDLLYAIGREAKASSLAAPVTIADALDAWSTRVGLSAGSRRRYAANGRYLSDLADMTVAGLSRADVEAVMEPLRERLSEGTWKSIGTTLAGALRDHGKADLCKGYTGRSTDRRRDPVVMTRATMDLIVAIGADHGVGDLLAIVADMGLRFGEAAAVDREHADTIGDAPTYRVRAQYPSEWTPERRVTPEPLKTRHGRRDVPMTPRLVDLAERTPSGLLTRNGYDGRGPWRYDVANYRLSRVSRDAIAEGLISRPVHFHDFRHSWGAHLLNGGVDLVTVSRLMGHSSIVVTGDTYGHLTPAGIDAVRSLMK